MIIVPQRKAVMLHVRDPDRILAVIPSARVITWQGKRLTVVPHRRDETKVLRNLGIAVPSPIRYYYDWPGMYKPFEAQLETADFLSRHNRAYCLSSMGVGKTIAALWAFDYLRGTGAATRALVVAPLSTLERTWADEVFRNFPHLDTAVLHGTRARRVKLLKQEADIYIVNHDGLKILAPELADRPDIDVVIYDELATVRNAQTDRWKAANEVCNKQSPRRVYGLTGTPIPNAPTDAWAQARLITPETVPKYFGKFKDITMRQVTQFKWVARDSALDHVQAAMQPSIRFSLDECVDLPEQVFLEREAPLTADQQKAYKAMLDTLRAEYAGGEIMAMNEAVKAQKLLQVAVGVAYGTDGSEITIPATHRLEVLDELIEESEGKVIVFVPFTGALNYVAAHVAKTLAKTDSEVAHLVAHRLQHDPRIGDHVAIVNGHTSKHARDEIFNDFQKGKDLRVIVAQPATMSHGLTLTAATTIVWYGLTNSNEIFAQANARMRRPGQKRTTVVACITGTAIERKMFDRLKNKQSTQGVLLDLIREQPK